MAVAVRGEQRAGLVEGGVVAQAGEGVGQRAVGAGGVERGVGGEQRQAQVAGEVDELAVEPRFVAQAVADELDVDVFAAEGVDQRAGGGERGGGLAVEQRAAERAVAVAGEGDERSALEGPSEKGQVPGRVGGGAVLELGGVTLGVWS